MPHLLAEKVGKLNEGRPSLLESRRSLVFRNKGWRPRGEIRRGRGKIEALSLTLRVFFCIRPR